MQSALAFAIDKEAKLKLIKPLPEILTVALRTQQPRISLNKLAEFMTARKANRQRSILKDQKFPTDYKGMYHKEASEAVASCIAGNLEVVSILDRAIAVLEQQNPDKIGTQRRLAQNVDSTQR